MRGLLLDNIITNLSFKGVLCIVLGLMLGILTLLLSPLYTVVIILGVFALYMSAIKPEIGVLIILVLISSIVFEDDLPLMPIGIGSLHLSDLLMMFLFMVLFYRVMTDSSFTVSRSPLNVPLTLFVMFALFSTYISISLYGVNFNQAFSLFRAVSYYLVYYLVANLIREKSQILFLVKGMFIVATIVTVVMIIQAIIGDAIILIPGRVEKSGTFDEEFETLRLLPPGQTLLYVLFIVAICIYSLNIREKLLTSKYIYLISILGAGVILTYNRTYWVAIILTYSILFIMSNKESKKRLLVLLGILIILTCAIRIMYADNTQMQEAIRSITMRFTSLFTGGELHKSSSVEARYIENEYALKQVANHPIIGIGLGNDYRPQVFYGDDEFTYYVHNGFMWILLDTGIIGFLLFFWFYIGFIIRCIRKWKFISDDYLRYLVVGFMLSCIGIIPMTLYNPIFMQWFSIVVIAIITGLTDSIINTSAIEKFKDEYNSQNVKLTGKPETRTTQAVL
ncbi:O-antigen ligase [Geobacter sp. AOG1]|uniref:O-antigen ligase family protein n=1 Tax=Geobacter sp. AOG1 TaxID=1566346 RepID=UPI001CC3B207|nr:O-antigen ligase family protein [Geobacter sp. AOG1]GFE58375.1 hypothetical protein AOG1_22550 [Geobacter sp. AOG1]